MARTTEDIPVEVDVSDVDQHDDFWAGPAARDGADLPPVGPEDADALDERAVAEYMGAPPRVPVERTELERLAGWARAQACADCTDALEREHDPEVLEHEGCRDALRVERVLRRHA